MNRDFEIGSHRKAAGNTAVLSTGGNNDWIGLEESGEVRDVGENNERERDLLYAGWGDGKGDRAVFDRSTNRAYYWTYY